MSSNLLQVLRLCQLSSPALPIGAFNFSQGVEYATQAGWITDEASASEWLHGMATHALATLDVPVLMRLHDAWRQRDRKATEYWSRYLIASRETAELRAEDRHMGQSLAKVLSELGMDDAREWVVRSDATLATLLALAGARWDIEIAMSASGYVWTWAENQVLAAVKLVPLGQSAYVRMLNRFVPTIPQLVQSAATVADSEIGISTPMQGIASASHETQYTRLFRS